MNAETSIKPSWVIVCTKPSSEEIAERSLRQAGYRVYLPRYRKALHPHGAGRRSTAAMRPLFTGYLFAQSWKGWPADPINGVIGLLRRAGEAVKMPEADVELIRAQEWGMRFDEGREQLIGKRTDISPGDTVAVEISGERVLAELAELTDSGRAIIETILFNRRVRLNVAASELQVVTA